jgi:putative PIN family toxin of toxin-antitoxin system
VLDELQRVLELKFKVPAALASDLTITVRDRALVAEPESLPQIEIRDSDDLNILAAALSCNAQVLVTGDKDLLELPPINGLSITTPRGFWEMLRG